MLAIGTGLGGFLTGYDASRKRALDALAEQQKIQDSQEQRKRRGQQDDAARALYGGLTSGDVSIGGLPGTTRAPGAAAGGGVGNPTALAPGMTGAQPQQRPTFGAFPGSQPVPQQQQDPGLAPGFARGADGGLTRNGQPPDTMIGGMAPGGGAMPAWKEGAPQPATIQQRNGQYAPVSGGPSPSPLSGGGSSRDLTQLANQVAPGILPPGYQVHVLRGDTPGARVAGTGGVSQHALGRAIDVQIIDPQGRKIPNTGEDTTGLYGKLATAMWGAAPPDMQGKMAWGGNFTTGPQNGPRDLMHFDLGGDRGRFGRLAQEARAGGQGGGITQVADRRPSGGAGALSAGAPPELQAQGQQTARQATQGLDPMVYGRMSLTALARQIDKANPGADPLVKMMALEMAQKLMAPDQQKMWEMYKLEHQENLQAAREAASERKMFEHEDAAERRQRAGFAEQEKLEKLRRDDAAGSILETDQGPMRVRPGSNKAEPIDIGGAKVMGKGGVPAPADIIAFDKDGKHIFQGKAQFDPQSKTWTNVANGEVIPADRIESSGKAVAGGAGRSGAQVMRQATSAREIQTDLESITQLPLATTRGIFGGRQQGPGVFDALKENLAEQLTDEDAELANSALAGIGRELSMVVSPVYGGKWASDSFNALTLKEGQTANVKLYNLARMRQVVDNSLETVINTGWVDGQTKEYAAKMRAGIDKAVPWTPQDVLAFRKEGSAGAKEGETFGQFIARNKVGGAAQRRGRQQEQSGAAVGSVPVPQEHLSDPDGTEYQGSDGQTYVKQGQQMVPHGGGGGGGRPDL